MSDCVILGVDAGKSGAVAIYTPPLPPRVKPLPVDGDGHLDASKFLDLIHAEIYGEDGPLPRVHLVTEATFRPLSLVAMTGAIRAVASLCCDAVDVVAVTTWKRAVLGANTSDKAVSVAKCRELWPTLSLKRTPRCKGPSHDFAEAALLAYYGWLKSQPN